MSKILLIFSNTTTDPLPVYPLIPETRIIFGFIKFAFTNKRM